MFFACSIKNRDKVSYSDSQNDQFSSPQLKSANSTPGLFPGGCQIDNKRCYSKKLIRITFNDRICNMS